jgi:Flp pilus assembly protein TadD
LVQFQRVDEAANELEAARTFEPHNATVLFELARLRLVQGRNTDAVPLLQRAHELAPDNREITEAWNQFTR